MSDTSSRRLEAALQGLVERVVEALPTEVQSVAQQYFDLQSPEDIVGRDVADLTQMIQS
ncbi:MAG: hypothetical protein F2839_06895, partial [Actinobacteria bacterium]|nr:hypothetical protein [Actinomycetota bacterium]